jgi:LPXTG-motif cell wall-anchored protein
MFRTATWIGLAVSVLAFLSAATVRADEWDKKSVLTFSQPFEVPGAMLPAGTYTFKIADMMSDRHIVQIFNADGSRLLATLMTIPDYRLKTTTDNVVKFNEAPRGTPQAIRAWFYPGNSVGQEFVYQKVRAAELARAAKAAVPAIAITDLGDVNVLKTAPIVAITPEEQEVPVTAAIQTAPVRIVRATSSSQGERAPAVEPTGQSARNTLPRTASTLPLIVSIGGLSLAVGALLMLVRRRERVSAG